MPEIAVPAYTDGVPAVVLKVPSFWTKCPLPVVRPVWASLTDPAIWILAVWPLVYPASENPKKLVDVRFVGKGEITDAVP